MLNWFKRKSAPPQRSATEAARPDVGAPSARPADPVAESDALIRQGNLHLDQGRLALAAQCYREAVLHQPNSVQARVNLGFVLRALGQLPEAAEQLEFALSLEPTQIDALFLLGLKAQSEGDVSRALEYLQRCHDSRPDFEPAIAPLCSMLQLAGRSAQAETVARAGLRLHPESADLHCVLAKLQAMRGLFSDALQNCDKAIRPAMRAPGATVALP
jgi:tetratricopeptide (TPR) repeat protein